MFLVTSPSKTTESSFLARSSFLTADSQLKEPTINILSSTQIVLL